MSEVGFWAVVVALVTAVATALVIAIAVPTYYVQKNGCYSFGRQTDREVRWVMYHLASWDCLTPARDGKWIPTKRLRDID